MRVQHAFTLFVVVLAVGVCFPLQSYGGWLLKDRDGSTTLIDGGRMKYTEEAGSSSAMLFDYNKGTVSLIEGERKVYATGSIDEYCTIMAKLLGAFDEMEGALGEEEESTPPAVKVVAAGSEEIGGFTADKYQVLVDGELYEERWITTDPRLIDEIGDMSKYEKLINCFEGDADDVEKSAAYMELNGKGWELRSISYDYGEKEYNNDTVSIEKNDPADGTFAPPSSFEKMGFEEFYLSLAQ